MSVISFPLRQLVVLAFICLLSGSGCSFFPEALQPHELWKLNRGKGPSSDPFFSRKENSKAKIIPTSYDRPALSSGRPYFADSKVVRGTDALR